jgi:hypothetical protein
MKMSLFATPTLRFLLAFVVVLCLGSFAFGQAHDPFTIVLLPDTQYYTDKYPDTYLAQTAWIKEHAKERNIQFVIHLGDIVDDGASEPMWKVADEAHRALDGAVPYSLSPGNHDMSDDKRDTTLFNRYFSPKRFEGCTWYGGHKDETNDNSFCQFEASGMKFLVVSLEYGPTDQTLDWANQILAAHPDRRAIVATHSYTNPEGRTPEGQRIWNKLVRRNPSVFLVASGHVCALSLQTARNDAGGTVYEILTDYQSLPNGGDGLLRTLRFVPAENRIHAETFSPTLKGETDKKYMKATYVLDCDMRVSRP